MIKETATPEQQKNALIQTLKKFAGEKSDTFRLLTVYNDSLTFYEVLHILESSLSQQQTAIQQLKKDIRKASSQIAELSQTALF